MRDVGSWFMYRGDMIDNILNDEYVSLDNSIERNTRTHIRCHVMRLSI